MSRKITSLAFVFALCVLGAMAAKSQSVSFDYTSLQYSPDGGAPYATLLYGISGTTAVGSYNVYDSYGDGTGSNGLIYDIPSGQWTVVEWPGSTLNRTMINGIDQGVYAGAYATIYPDPDHQHQNKNAWLGTYGLVGGAYSATHISNPNVDVRHETEGTYMTNVWMSSAATGTFVGYYLDKDGISNGFQVQLTESGLADYEPIARNPGLIPSDVEGSRIVGNTNSSNTYGEYGVGFLYDGTDVTLLQAPWAVDPNNPEKFYETQVGGISGDWIAGTWYDQEGLASGFLYNIGTQEWWQVDDVPGSMSTYIYGIDGNTIVGVWTVELESGGTEGMSFIGTTDAIPEPGPLSLAILALGALAVAAKFRRQASQGCHGVLVRRE